MTRNKWFKYFFKKILLDWKLGFSVCHQLRPVPVARSQTGEFSLMRFYNLFLVYSPKFTKDSLLLRQEPVQLQDLPPVQERSRLEDNCQNVSLSRTEHIGTLFVQ